MKVKVWAVFYEARPLGALGVFEAHRITVVAESTEDAYEEAARSIDEQGTLERRFPLRCYPWISTDEARACDAAIAAALAGADP